jgi:GNAT superfamily N-acetyltransferase
MAALHRAVPNFHCGRVRLLVVDPAARGHQIGGRLVDECITFARAVGYTTMRLSTANLLTAAGRLYLSRGFRLVVEEPRRRFGFDMVAQVYELDLAESRTRSAAR